MKRLAARLPLITVPAARSAIVWVLGEFQAQPAIAKLGPDALRVLAKNFRNEDVSVKLQIMTLAVKTVLRHTGEHVRDVGTHTRTGTRTYLCALSQKAHMRTLARTHCCFSMTCGR